MARKVIIDCDPGIDDGLAIMLALSMPEEIEVLAITVVAGNAPVEAGYQNALKILRFMGRLDLPVFKGAERPLKREYIDALDTHGPDGLGGCGIPELSAGEYVRQEMGAVEYMSKVLIGDSAGGCGDEPVGRRELLLKDVDSGCRQVDKSAEGGVSIIALGPLTNLALLAKEDPEAFGRIEELVSMGGAFRIHGNCSPVAEYNYWCDPDAAAVVYEEMGRRGKQVHMVGLDVTRRIVLTPDLLSLLRRLDPVMGSFIEKITGFYFDFHWKWEHLIGCVINDPLAVAYFARRELCRGFPSYVQIEREGIGIGQSIVDSMEFYRHSPNAIVLTQTDPAAFFRIFFSALVGLEERDAGLLDSLVRS